MKIEIKKKFLIFREDAKKIKRICEKELEYSDFVLVDFSNVNFVSRSFTDELLNIIEKEERIKILNLNYLLRKLLNTVKKTRKKLSVYNKISS